MPRRAREKSKPPGPAVTAPAGAARPRAAVAVLLVLVLLVAGALRLVRCSSAFPGLQVDEASNAWNAWCLLKTGTDQHGMPWPVFYTRAFGDNRSPLYLYLLLPFQAAGGCNVCTTRLPAALGGIATVLLLYGIGARQFDRTVGLVAAGLLAVAPWHIQQTRWGHEGSVTPLLVAISWAALLWAGAPFTEGESKPLRPGRALLAGAVTGLCCYGYAAVRLFLPVFLAAAVAVTWRAWRALARTRGGATALLALVLGFAGTFGPLAWKHATDPEINKRGRTTWVWAEEDGAWQRLSKSGARYLPHFGADFLFRHGDTDPALSPPGAWGLFPWTMLPLGLFGLGSVVPRLRGSRAARVLLVAVLAYPVSDLTSEHPGMHALRSFPGICGLVLLGAVGAVAAARFAARRGRALGVGMAGSLALLLLWSSVAFGRDLFGRFDRDPAKYGVRHVDLLEAFGWLRPRFGEVDAVYCTISDFAYPYVHAAIGLGYDPRQWFRDERRIIPGPLPWYREADFYLGFGKIEFMFVLDPALLQRSQRAVEALRANGRRDRVVFIARPGELSIERTIPPVHVIRRPDGQTALLIFDLNL